MRIRLLAGHHPPPLTAGRAFAATMLGFSVLAAWDAVTGPLLYWPGSAGALAARTLWGLGSILLCGSAFALLVAAVCGAAQWASLRLGAGRARLAALIRVALLMLVSTGVACTFLPDALDLAAHTVLGGRHGSLILAGFMVVAGGGIALLVTAGHAMSRRTWIRWLPIGLASFGMYENFRILSDDYPEVHCVIGWCTAVLLGFAASSLLDVLVARRRRAWVMGGLAAGLAAFALVVPAPNAVRLHLFRSAGSGAWPLGMVLWRLPELPAPMVPARSVEWYHSREDLPPVAPTPREASAEAPIVVLVTVDALRGDLLRDRQLDALWPTLAKLRDDSIYFPRARTPGSQTAVSMATLFSGRYFSQLRWTKYGVARSRLAYPVDDPAVRFPDLLTKAGVSTFKVASVRALANEFGLAGGFAEEDVIPAGRGMAVARQMIDPIALRLDHADGKPLFVFTHLLEAHGPYIAGARYLPRLLQSLPPGRRRINPSYLGAVMAVDKAFEGLVATLDDPRIAERVVLIVSADHGEAFGEHGYLEHAKSLHEELLDVPLLVRARGLEPRVVEERAGLIDLGPTILDWFGQPTPSAFMGQSLVPILLDRPFKLTRPDVAEGRLRRSLRLGDIKLIVDERRKVMEAYDLSMDPGELRNLWDVDRTKLDDVSAAMRAFFDAHEHRANGYRPVFRR